MLRYASLSKTGNRKCNEDYLRISSISNRHCFVVCDGLGGHEYGDVAAKITANTFVDELCYAENLSDFLKDAFIKAQKNIELKQKLTNAKKDMKTTAVCMVTDEKSIYTVLTVKYTCLMCLRIFEGILRSSVISAKALCR